ncbi:hypothetical protein ACFX2I_007437 [Malus domestica]
MSTCFWQDFDHNLDQVCSRVLATASLPDLNEAYVMVCRESQHQVTMVTGGSSEASTLAKKHLQQLVVSTAQQFSSDPFQKPAVTLINQT